MDSRQLWLLIAGVGGSSLLLVVGILLTVLVSGATFAAASIIVVGLIGWHAFRRLII